MASKRPQSLLTQAAQWAKDALGLQTWDEQHPTPKHVALVIETTSHLLTRERLIEFTGLLSRHGRLIFDDPGDAELLAGSWPDGFVEGLLVSDAGNLYYGPPEELRVEPGDLPAHDREYTLESEATVGEIWLDLPARSARLPSVHVTIPTRWLQTDEQFAWYLDFAKALFGWSEGAYGFMDRYEWAVTIRGGLFTQSYSPPSSCYYSLPGVYWANFLGPDYVEWLTAEVVESTPCWSIERLAGGGALLLLGPRPVPGSTRRTLDDAPRLAVKRHLGVERFAQPKDGSGWSRQRRETPDFDFSQLPVHPDTKGPIPLDDAAD